MQINFGVILNESLGDAVKITVIATGFQPENSPVPERRGVVTPVIKVQQRPPEPEPLPDLPYVAAARAGRTPAGARSSSPSPCSTWTISIPLPTYARAGVELGSTAMLLPDGRGSDSKAIRAATSGRGLDMDDDWPIPGADSQRSPPSAMR